ncbi:MAG: hypothetical protein K5695_00180 [Oscillospiraceae bacterium]|nr:hypothetical protein [Oscillospiraceae bacterium]
MGDETRLIFTNDKCVGCNKCINVCSAMGACISTEADENGRSRINVAFGADITTWGYLKYIQEHDFIGGISQPCPAVVTYIEKYVPELLPCLFPVQSPLMCAAIYARKQMGITDRFAFLSPCIAKKLEISDPANEGLVQYNVTFSHFMKMVREKGLYGEPIRDEVEYGLGAVYPMPGGLKEDVRWFLGDGAFVRQIEGERHMYEFLKSRAQHIVNRDIPFLLIDALNFENGCLCGTATEPAYSNDKALCTLMKIQEHVKADTDETDVSRSLTPAQRLAELNKRFAHLDLHDYLRTYRDLSASCPVHMPDAGSLEQIYLSMGKRTEASRHINCMSCGYNSCYDMATGKVYPDRRKEGLDLEDRPYLHRARDTAAGGMARRRTYPVSGLHQLFQ